MNDYSFGNSLMNLRKGYGFSQFQLGKLMGVSDKAVSKWETGKSYPDILTCKKLAELFGITLDRLVQMNEPDNPNKSEAPNTILWQKAHKRIYELFGEKPPVSFIARFESEKTLLQHTDLVFHLAFVSHVMKTARGMNTHVIPRAWINNFFTAWLLGATYVNPLPAYSHCPVCHRTVMHTGSKDGWDNIETVCSCGAKMEVDGHNLPFDIYVESLAGNSIRSIDLNVPSAIFNNGKQLILDTYGGSYIPVEYVISAETAPDSDQPVPKRAKARHYLLVAKNRSLPQISADGCVHTTMEELFSLYRNTPRINLILDETLDLSSDCELNHKVLGSKDLYQSLLNKWFEEAGIKQILADCPKLDNPVSFSTLCILQGLRHGNGIWENNGSEYVDKGVAKLEDLAAFREDVWHMVLNSLCSQHVNDAGLPLKVMNNVRLGRFARKGMDKETLMVLEEIGIPGWYIDHISRIQYQFPKGHAVAFIISELARLHSSVADSNQQ